MSDKKHIDRLFQERFKDFEATPNDTVWENIEAQLNKKKKKHRVIPIWWRYAGAAAILLLLLTIGNNLYNNTNENPEIEAVENNDDTPKINNEDKIPNSVNDNKTIKVVEDEDSSTLKLKKDSNERGSSFNKNIVNDNAVADNDNTEESKPQRSFNKNKINNTKQPTVIAKTNSLNKSKKSSTLNLEEQAAVSLNSKTENKTPAYNKKSEGLIDTNAFEKTHKLSKNTTVAKNELTIENETNVLSKDESKQNGLTIEEALDKNKADEINEENSKLNRWRIAANAAPVYFNTMNEDGSSIDPQFNGNSKSGEINLSYGISTSYAINKNLSIRSGVNKVNLGYNTNDVVVFQSISARSSSALMNVDDSVNNSSTEDILTGASTQEAVSVISADGLNNIESFNTTSINQSLGYIEVPLEIQYTLSSKKLGVNIIGGFSSFFLDDNKIFSETTDGIRTFLGEATNINKVSYSANFGLGLNYEVSKIIDLNLEPMFKYQINTFNNTTGDFKPYILGVYTGFVIKF